MAVHKRNGWRESLFYGAAGIVIAVLVYQLLGFALNTTMPVLDVMSCSMVPAFYKGDLAVIRGVQPQDINIGDVIVFSVQNRPVPIIHRVVGKRLTESGYVFTTKGDNRCTNPVSLPEETEITPQQIRGKMLFTMPYLGWVKIALSGDFKPCTPCG